jgi:beta-galactosidase
MKLVSPQLSAGTPIPASISLRASRETLPLNSDWRFIRQSVDLAAATTAWESVTLPHTWNAVDGQAGSQRILNENQSPAEAAQAAAEARVRLAPTSDPHFQKGYYQGACWYARTLEAPADWKGRKRIFVRFGAACLVARTFLNQRILGEHRGAFTAFAYELTDLLNYSSKNDLRVEVDNSYREDIPPQSGDFNLWGGLYRTAELIVADIVCINPLHFASAGVYLTTKSLQPNQAVVEVKTLVSNGEKPPRFMVTIPPATVTVEAAILDAGGNTVARSSVEQSVAGETTATVIQTLALDHPHLWQGRSDPYLYTATVRVVQAGQVIDAVTQPLGLRTVAITPQRGFELNGRPYPIHGVCRHQDRRDQGWALSPADEEADTRFILEIGATAVRNAHYPQSESWHALGDRLGLLLWDEVPVVNETRNTRAFWENTYEQMREMVHQLYNHPSIAWWGIYNEIENLPTPPSGPELQRLRDIARELDPRRIVVAASDQGNRYYNLIPDQIAFNVYPGWYVGDWPKEEGYVGHLDQFAEFIEDRHREAGKRIAFAEYGAGGDIAHHTEGPPAIPEPAHGGPFQPEEWQTYVHEFDWATMKDHPMIWGTFFWAMFDFAAANRSEGSAPALNTKGLVTHDRRIRKDAFFLYKANWNPEPMVYITSSRAALRRLPVTEIKVYSNAESVELRLNGRSLGPVRPDRIQICRWPAVRLSPGTNCIEALGHFQKGAASDSCEWLLVTTP